MERYIDGCNICQRIKNCTEAPVGELIVNKVLERLWTHLMVDFIIELLLIARKNTILVVYNRLFKMTHFVATMEGTLLSVSMII